MGTETDGFLSAQTVLTTWRKKPVEVSGIRWDGSDEAKEAIRAAGGQPVGPLNGRLAFWVAKASAVATIHSGDWVMLEPDGNGVYPVKAADHEATYEPAGRAADGRSEVERLRNGAHTLGRIVSRLTQAMEAARIEMVQNGPEKAMQWILNGLPDGYEGDVQWNGTETASEWIDRAQDAAPKVTREPVADGEDEMVSVSLADLTWALNFLSVDGAYTQEVRDRLAAAAGES